VENNGITGLSPDIDSHAAIAVFGPNGARVMASPPDDEVSLEDEWPELTHGPCSTYNLRLWLALDPEQYAARNGMLLAALLQNDWPENIFRSVLTLFGTWEEEGFYEPMRKRWAEAFAAWAQHLPICSATDPAAPNLTQSPCSPRNLPLWSVVTTDEYAARNTRIRILLQNQESPKELLYSVYELMSEYEYKDFLRPMRERWTVAFDALSDDDPMSEGGSPMATKNQAGSSSNDEPTRSSMASEMWSKTFEASQLALLRAGGWTPSTRAKRKRAGSRDSAARASSNASSRGDAAEMGVART